MIKKNLAGTETLKAKRVIVHPQYDDNNADFDFALIEPGSRIFFAPIALNTTEIQIPSGSKAQHNHGHCRRLGSNKRKLLQPSCPSAKSRCAFG